MNNTMETINASSPMAARFVELEPPLSSAIILTVCAIKIQAPKENITKRVFIPFCSLLNTLAKNKNSPAKQIIAKIIATVYDSGILNCTLF